MMIKIQENAMIRYLLFDAEFIYKADSVSIYELEHNNCVGLAMNYVVAMF